MLLPKPKQSDIKLSVNKNVSQEETILPKIFFGSSQQSYYSGPQDTEDLYECPSYSVAIDMFSNLNSKDDISLISKGFQNAIQVATNRIWIIDTYLANTLEKNENKKLEILYDLILNNSSKVDTRFYLRNDIQESETARLAELTKTYNDHIREKQKTSNATIIGYKLFKNMKFIHDRFAIIDDNLWHFGSDVGASQPSFHATSFGWNANELKITNFFEELWRDGK